jgi:hypothetical protein
MNYDQPRELADESGWHYTRMNDGEVRALGYCRDHLDQPHATEDEARACYTRWLLETRLFLDGRGDPDVRRRCEWEGCETFTDRIAQVNPADMSAMYFLCDDHRTREHVAELFGTVGDSIHS